MPSDDPPGVETFSAYAAHEAAHAVVTAALGITVRRILVVQLTGMLKLAYDGWKPKEDCSHSQPDCKEYRAADPIKRCLVARAGEVGQRLYLDDKGVVDPEHWTGDRKDIKDETGLSGSDLEVFLETLRAPIEQWIQEAEPKQAWRNLTERLVTIRNPHPGDRGGDRFRSVLESDELQKLLKNTPPFPAQRIPPMCKLSNGNRGSICGKDK